MSSSSSSQTNAVTLQNSVAIQQKELQVSGLRCFPENRWREAILYYLFGIWGNKKEVTYRPKINLGGVTLRLDHCVDAYYAYGFSEEEYSRDGLGIGELSVGYQRLEVENGLIRFVKDDTIRALFINFANGGRLCIWKKSQRSRFGISCRGIPIAM
jgi:hypothetical protein